MLEIGAGPLRSRDIARAARNSATVSLHGDAWARIAASHEALLRFSEDGAAIYGVSTGLGAAVDMRLDPNEAERQRRIVLARMVGVGAEATPVQIRATMLARLAGLAEGASGISPAMVRAYLAMLNAGVQPVMPLTGSVGEADLATLAHVAGPLAGAGEAWVAGDRLPGGEALVRAGITPPPFAAKDGLALISSNAASVGLATLVLDDAEKLFGGWLAAAAISFEAYRANLGPLSADAAGLRPAPGQAEAGAALLALLADGALSAKDAARRLQDPLSFRCIAPVLGAALTALRTATASVELELNSADDNPAIRPDAVGHNANFDPTHLALAMEGLGLAVSRVTTAQGWRVLKLMNADSTGLPRFLSAQPGGGSGLAPLQKTVAALVGEIGQLAMPLPAWMLPSADGVEDHCSMALTVVRRVGDVIAQARLLCATELLVAAQAWDLRGSGHPGRGAAQAFGLVRAKVPILREERPVGPDVTLLDAMIEEGAFIAWNGRLWNGDRG